MKQNKLSIIDSILIEQNQINKIRKILIHRYKIYDKYLLEELTISLLENGISIDKFNEKYYDKHFDIDEIVYYLMDKIIEKKELKIVYKKRVKIINFNENKTKNRK